MEKANPGNFYHYNSKLTERARQLRKNMTKAEACLWKYVLKAGKMEGYTFRRQRPILNYIVDFVCLKLLLIIEVDGITHTYKEVNQNDIKRQSDLQSIGFKVLRFDDDEILTNINSVHRAISNEIHKITNVS